jgi:hypothetical protein
VDWTKHLSKLQEVDIIIAAWFLLGEPLLQRLLGIALRGLDFLTLSRDLPNSGFIGLLFWGSVLGAVGAMATRTSTDPATFLNPESPSGYAYFPMATALAYIVGTANDLHPMPGGDKAVGVVTILSFVAFLLHKWLPPLPGIIRRLMMTPIILVCSWILSSTLGDLLQQALDQNQSDIKAMVQTLVPWAGLIFLATTIFYLMFIFAPRHIASRDDDWSSWFLRYLVYFAGLVASIILPRLLRVGF